MRDVMCCVCMVLVFLRGVVIAGGKERWWDCDVCMLCALILVVVAGHCWREREVEE